MRTMLREADAAARPVESEGDAALIACARREAARRRRGRAVRGAALAVVAMTAMVMAVVMRVGEARNQGATTSAVRSEGSEAVAVDPSRSAPIAEADRRELERIEAEIARLESEARVHGAVVETMLSVKPAAAGPTRQRRDPVDRARDEVERAAFVMMLEADRKREDRGLHEEAAADYRRVAELFGDTAWAEVARQRLSGAAEGRG